MQNVKLEVKDTILVITVDLTKDLGPSKSGKTHLVATTGGSVEVPNHPGMKLGLNIFK